MFWAFSKRLGFFNYEFQITNYAFPPARFPKPCRFKIDTKKEELNPLEKYNKKLFEKTIRDVNVIGSVQPEFNSLILFFWYSLNFISFNRSLTH